MRFDAQLAALNLLDLSAEERVGDRKSGGRFCDCVIRVFNKGPR